jgi:hypothetical protein
MDKTTIELEATKLFVTWKTYFNTNFLKMFWCERGQNSDCHLIKVFIYRHGKVDNVKEQKYVLET